MRNRPVVSKGTWAWIAVVGACGCGGEGLSPAETEDAPEISASPPPEWPGPEAQGQVEVPHTIALSGEVFDGGMQRYYGVGALGSDDQDENQSPLFDLYADAVVKNVILGAPAADGIHCNGSCTLENVWWEDVGEDAATFRGSSDEDVLLIDGGGARLATDKVFQNNGRGTFHIKDFHVEDFGKLYRSCGNCEEQMPRSVIVENVTAVTWEESDAVVGINENYGDTAEFRGISRIFDSFETPICQRYEGNDQSLEPLKVGDGPDGTHCKYDGESVLLIP